MEPQTAAVEAAVQLPPQLAAALGDNASNVAEMCFLAPGIPWSNQLLDDMMADIRNGQIGRIDCDRNGTMVRVELILQIMMETRRRPRRDTLSANIFVMRSSDRGVPDADWSFGRLHHNILSTVLGYASRSSGANRQQTTSCAGAFAIHAARATLSSAPAND